MGTFNVFNLVLPGVGFYGDQLYSPDAFRRKSSWIGTQLDRMRADIVGFQEVFHREALQEALERSETFHGCEVVMPDDGQDKVRPRVALASRFPVIDLDSIQEFPSKLSFRFEGGDLEIERFRRPILKAVVEVAHQPVTVFIAHLKSKRPDFAESEDPGDHRDVAVAQARSQVARTAEATALRWLLVDAMLSNDHPVALMGDLNDALHTVTAEIIAGLPPRPEATLDERRRIWDCQLYSTYEYPTRRSYRDVFYTHLHNGRHETLDHIFVSQEFVAQNPRCVGIVEDIRVYNDHLVDPTLSPDDIPPWASDHAQVVATLLLREPRH